METKKQTWTEADQKTGGMAVNTLKLSVGNVKVMRKSIKHLVYTIGCSWMLALITVKLHGNPEKHHYPYFSDEKNEIRKVN